MTERDTMPERPGAQRLASVDTPSRPPQIRAPLILTPIVEHWLSILLTGLLLGGGVVALMLSRPRRYEASVTVAPVGNARSINLPGGFASSLLGGTGGGVQATPIFVSRLSRLRNVLDAVALQHVPGDEQHTVIERLLARPLAEIPAHRYSVELAEALGTSVDRESGTVTFKTSLADSTLARTIMTALVAQVRATYTRATKSQATELREAQVTRVDSAQNQLREAEQAMVRFTSGNRVVPDHSLLWVEQQRLQSDLQVAQSVYTQAVTEIQTARGKELEDAPALVVLDPVPRVLPPASRGTVVKATLAFLFGVLLAAVFVVVREAMANAYASASGETRRLFTALMRIPLVGGVLVRRFVRA